MKLKKTKMGKRLVTFCLCAIILVSSALSVSAVEQITTGDVYMDGYKLYGTLTLYSTNASGYTYCEKEYAGKSAYTYFAYYSTAGPIYYVTGGSSDYDYSQKYSVTGTTPNANADYFDYYAGAKTISKVIYPNQTYYNWTSEGTDNELRMGYYKTYE